ncbi:META domain-containing protein [Pseudoalteromonas sp. C2R02]|uniref:META domain-containing protein n=1 Tax=Pseudoalteromonas sp. C2R02 TaxID=2841565 RepID=UPI001C08A628|nr:META domain-containing protein [Pseudoalteromonas sp. C2R02]MBU2970095.1 META domain-containing protein [Pseudoalteromonas sp. C2R02]
MKSIYKIYTYLIVVICFLSISACQSITEAKLAQSYKSNAPLINSYWKMLEVNKQTILVSEGQREAFIQLRHNNKIKGFTGCNHITGSYSVNTTSSQQTLRFNKINTTEKFCTEGMELQTSIAPMLQKVNSYKISGDSLFLYNKNNDVIAKLASIYF